MVAAAEPIIHEALNHSGPAAAMYLANNPGTRVWVQDVRQVCPRTLADGRKIGLAWFSPDCTTFSKARGGAPLRDPQKPLRDLPDVVIEWARHVKPRIIMLENVEEITKWGPLGEDGKHIKSLEGLEWKRWLRELRACGYKVEWRELRASEYGSPTIRKRLFLIARCDGKPIVWPKPTHGIGQGQRPFRTAAECIDWSIPCPSIFTRRKPLKPNTLRRIARGIMRYVVNAKRPFIVPITHAGPKNANNVRCNSVDVPIPTLTTQAEFAVVSPIIAGCGGRAGQSRPRSANEPLATITSKADQILVAPSLMMNNTNNAGASVEDPLPTVTTGNRHFLTAPLLIPRYGEREGQEPRCRSVEQPLPTIVPTGNGAELVTAECAAWIAQHNADQVGRPAEAPLSTITSRGMAQQVVASQLAILKNHCEGQSVEDPLGTVMAGGTHFAEVRAFLAQHNTGATGHPADEPLSTVTGTGCQQNVVTAGFLDIQRSNMSGQGAEEPFATITQTNHFAQVVAFLQTYYGVDQDTRIENPLPTVTTKHRFGLVTIDAIVRMIVDIGMRMLTARELFNAQGFDPDYIIDPAYKGKPLTKTAQIKCCGNSVCPQVAEALVRANVDLEDGEIVTDCFAGGGGASSGMRRGLAKGPLIGWHPDNNPWANMRREQGDLFEAVAS